MKHLQETGMSYFEHMRYALSFSIRLTVAALALVVHAVFPELFTSYASDQVAEMFRRTVRGDRILVRFNTKWQDDPLARTWRVLVNGVETLASDVIIDVPCQSIKEDVAPGVTKWHMLCYGKVTWQGDVARIVK